MRTFPRTLRTFCGIAILSSMMYGQDASPAAQPVAPRLVNFAGHAVDAAGKTISGVAGVTFAIYRDQDGGAPLWIETQTVTADEEGSFTAQLGATKPVGLPLDLFSSGDARWLGVSINGGEEQARVLLMSVPYALKAVDAQTLNGLPASAFVLAAPPNGTVSSSLTGSTTSASSTPPPPASAVTTSGGAANTLPLFSTGTDIENSAITQAGSGTTAKIGIGNTTPAATFDVKGSTIVRGALLLPATGTATATAGKSSQPENFVASVFNSSTATAVNQTFQWKAEQANNNTANASAVLSLLYGTGTATPADTGLRIGPKGLFGFAPGQTFPGTGPGTITGVTAGTALTGGGSRGAVTLNVDATKVPLLAANNVFTGNQTVNGNVSATGVVSGSAYQIGSGLFAFGSTGPPNAFTGFAGNTTMFGDHNFAQGMQALSANTNGFYNTAIGNGALVANTFGGSNTAVGYQTLYASSGSNAVDNTAIGFFALSANTSGGANTADGAQALFSNIDGSYNVADGAGALGAFSGNYNTGLGASAGGGATIGDKNVAVGSLVMQAAQSPNNDTAIGVWALNSPTTGANNSASGYYALYPDTTGASNNAYGAFALGSNTTGASNNAMGDTALWAGYTDTTTGNQNTGVGDSAMAGIDTGSGNTAFGAYAGGVGAGFNNTAIGFSSRQITGTAGADAFNTTTVGAFAQVSRSNSVVLGSLANSVTGTPQSYVGIGTSAPSSILTIGQGLGAPIADGWSAYSSRRWKTNIKTLPDALAKVQKMRGVSYDLKANGKHEIGVIAEEVGAAVPEVVGWEENGKDARSVDYARLTALLIEASKQQQATIRAQQRQIRIQQKQIRAQKAAAIGRKARIAELATQVKAIHKVLHGQDTTATATLAASRPLQRHR